MWNKRVSMVIFLFVCNLPLLFPVNECTEDMHNCHVDGFCTDTHGSFNCTCNPGFRGNGTSCENSMTDSLVLFLLLYTRCSCYHSQYVLQANLHICFKIFHAPILPVSGYSTYLQLFLELVVEMPEIVLLTMMHVTVVLPFVAFSVNECTEDMHNCHADGFCTDTHGSFNCTCNPGFRGNGTSCPNSKILVGNRLAWRSRISKKNVFWTMAMVKKIFAMKNSWTCNQSNHSAPIWQENSNFYA